jgi:hypothetical protein
LYQAAVVTTRIIENSSRTVKMQSLVEINFDLAAGDSDRAAAGAGGPARFMAQAFDSTDPSFFAAQDPRGTFFLYGLVLPKSFLYHTRL